MNILNVENDFKNTIASKVRIHPEGIDRYRIFSPFLFEDGDHLSVVLKREGNRWIFSDEGHTYMHLTYDLDEKELQRGTRQRIISNILSVFSIQDRQGELVFGIQDDRWADSLYSFIQALLKISDVTYLTRERARSTFLEDFKQFMEESIPEHRRQFDWSDPNHDSDNKYPIDCRVNNMSRPLFIQALPNDDKTRDATISLLQYEKWGVPFRSLAIFENQEEINRKVLARFTDICEKQFSSLAANRERIISYIEELLS